MKRSKVKSSTIQSIGYDPTKKLLEVEFMSHGTPGIVYQYENVPEKIFNDLKKAKSKGSFFYKNIRTNELYKYKKLGGETK